MGCAGSTLGLTSSTGDIPMLYSELLKKAGVVGASHVSSRTFSTIALKLGVVRKKEGEEEFSPGYLRLCFSGNTVLGTCHTN